MALSTEEIAAAEKMHLFVRAWEKHRPNAWRSMWILLPIYLSNGLHLFREKNRTFAFVWLGIWLGMMVAFFFVYRAQRARYERERLILGALEREHADELPWIAEERVEEKVKDHLAAVQRIQQDLTHGHA